MSDFDDDVIHNDDLLRNGSQIGEKIDFEKGLRKGALQDAYQNKLETAKILTTMHLSCADIVKVTGLSEDEIKKL